ncbi:ARMT1-like domain-containing protein [Kiritimatiellota bacterium B12222]|nr:ARMT1-like domain-containing protein [Kiritimatiellota bacterium B12222]
MHTSLDCIPCFVRQTLDACRKGSDDPAIHEQVLREVLHWISEMDLSLSPPALAQRIHRRLREITGDENPYEKDKAAHNQLALSLLPALEKKVQASHDPLIEATQLAIAGNIIDLGAKSGLSEGDVLEALEHAASVALTGDVEAYRAAVSSAKRILYLADNAGEIIFDRLLIEQLGGGRVTVAVRGRPIINDATLIDAEVAGLGKFTTVIDNGSDAPGTLLDECSEAFQRCFHEADLILSKGQGNYESLSGSSHPQIFFLFKVKCPVVAETANTPMGSHALLQNQPIS